MIGRGTIKKTYKPIDLFYYGTGGRKETYLLTMAEAVKELDIYGDWLIDETYYDPATIKAALTAGNQLQTPLAYYERGPKGAITEEEELDSL